MLAAMSACVAALVSCGQGEDAGDVGFIERFRLSGQARSWLRDDLTYLRRQVELGRGARVATKLQQWLGDPDLAGVRDEDRLEGLPKNDAESWRAFWVEVHEVLDSVR